MAFRQPECHQQMLFPPSLDEYISPDDPVRAYDAFVEALDFEALQIACDPQQPGCPAYHPKTMLKILVYGYSYGVRSSRKLERALYHNLSFIWLAGGLKPDFKTLSRFRKDNRKALKDVLKHCARLCIELKVIAGNTLFVDGTKLRANASLSRSWTGEQCRKQIEQVDQRIDEILQECEKTDEQEAGQDSMVHLQEDLAAHQSRKAKIEAALRKLQAEDLTRVNLTDPDCAPMHGRQGSHAGYNGQIVVDNQHGLIVHTDVVNDNNDCKQFAPQITAAAETTGHQPEGAGAEGGYDSGPELETRAAVATEVLVPARGQAHPSPAEPFAKEGFTYLAQEEVYVGPAGHRLTYRRT